MCVLRVAFDVLQHFAASRQQEGSRQECNSTRSHAHACTKENTSSVLWNAPSQIHPPMLERCVHASTHCVHTYEQTRLHAALGSDSVVTALLGFSEVKQFQFMWLSRGTWSPACHEKLARLPLSLILSLSVPSQQLLAGLGSERWTAASPPVCSTPIIYVHWRWCKVLERL